jgi:hypothetical protein
LHNKIPCLERKTLKFLTFTEVYFSRINLRSLWTLKFIEKNYCKIRPSKKTVTKKKFTRNYWKKFFKGTSWITDLRRSFTLHKKKVDYAQKAKCECEKKEEKCSFKKEVYMTQSPKKATQQFILRSIMKVESIVQYTEHIFFHVCHSALTQNWFSNT